MYALLIFILLVGAINCYPLQEIFKVPNNYRHFEQCNPQWGNNLIESTTVCKVGCLMTSVSMALNYYNISIDGKEANPGTLNQWLKDNGGYTSDNDFNEETLEKLSSDIKYKGKMFGVSNTEIMDYLNDGTVTIAHVRNGTHFVLITGYTVVLSDSWLVNDPYFNQTIYITPEIVGYRIFTMK